jgi:hypothetical protein
VTKLEPEPVAEEHLSAAHPKAGEVIKAVPFMWDRSAQPRIPQGVPAGKADFMRNLHTYNFLAIYSPHNDIALHHFAATTKAQTVRAAQVRSLLIQNP